MPDPEVTLYGVYHITLSFINSQPKIRHCPYPCQVWIDPSTGIGTPYVHALEAALGNSSVVVTALLLIFAVAHSGGAYLRPYGEALIGKRGYRVLFAGISLPLAVSAVVYFINHRYDGPVLWNIQGAPGLYAAIWIMNFVSFFFLYPSTFNLKEVAAVDQPEVHLWETGIIRITRHP